MEALRTSSHAMFLNLIQFVDFLIQFADISL